MPHFELNDFDSYVKFTDTTALYPGAGLATSAARDYADLGLFGEAGEVSNKMKKLLRGDFDEGDYKANLGTEDFVEKMIGELGGVYWYLARMVRENQMPVKIIQMVWNEFEAESKPWQVNDLASAAEAVLALSVALGTFLEDKTRENFTYVVRSVFEITYGLGLNGNRIISENTVKLASRMEREVIKGDGDDR